MTAIAPVIYDMGNASLKIGANTYELSVSSAKLTPSVNIIKFKGISPLGIYRQAGTPEWTLELQYAQDFATATSLSNYLLTNAGQTVVADLYPVVGGPGYRCSVVVVPGELGGQVGNAQTATVTLEVVGQPTLISA